MSFLCSVASDMLGSPPHLPAMWNELLSPRLFWRWAQTSKNLEKELIPISWALRSIIKMHCRLKLFSCLVAGHGFHRDLLRDQGVFATAIFLHVDAMNAGRGRKGSGALENT